MNCAAVSRSFETSRRREVLSYSHHVEVASLPPDEADELLDKAEREGLSTREVRRNNAGRACQRVYLLINGLRSKF